MTLPKILSLLVLILAACSSGQRSKPHVDTSQETKTINTSRYADLYPSVIQDLDKKNVTQNGSYYMLTQFSDSAVKIVWGNDTIKRVYKEPLDFMFAERLRIEWNNKDYLILRYGVGSGAWETVAFPINNKEQVQVFDNGLSFDIKNNLLAAEHWQDTVLIVQNLKTHQKQFIIEKEKPCDAVGGSSCIDTININDKVLYYKWTTPHKFSEKKKTIDKRVRLTI